MYLFLWLYLEYTSKNASRCVRYGACATVRALWCGPQRDPQAGHLPNPLAILEGHQPGPAGVALGDPAGAHAPNPLAIVERAGTCLIRDKGPAPRGPGQNLAERFVYVKIRWRFLHVNIRAERFLCVKYAGGAL